MAIFEGGGISVASAKSAKENEGGNIMSPIFCAHQRGYIMAWRQLIVTLMASSNIISRAHNR